MVGLLFTANYNKTIAQFMYYNHTMIGLSVRENLHCHGYIACLYRSAYHFFLPPHALHKDLAFKALSVFNNFYSV